MPPTKCSVPGCISGSGADRRKRKIEGRKVPSLFSIPRDPDLLKEWKKLLPISQREGKRSQRVCELHFLESDIVRKFTSTLPDGSTWTLERGKVVLKQGAIPSIFPTLFSNSVDQTQEIAKSSPRNKVKNSKRKLSIEERPFELVEKFTFVPEIKNKNEEKEKYVNTENISNNSSFVSVNLKNYSNNVFSTACEEMKPRSKIPYPRKKFLVMQNSKEIQNSKESSRIGIQPTDPDGDPEISPIKMLPIEQNDEETEIRPIRILPTEKNDEESEIRPVKILPFNETDIRTLPTEQNNERTELKPVRILQAKKQVIETTNKWSFISNMMLKSEGRDTQVDIDTNNLLSTPKHYPGDSNIESVAKCDDFNFNSLLKNVKLWKMPHQWSITYDFYYLIFAKWNYDYVTDRRVIINHDLNVKVFLRDVSIDVPQDKKIDSIKDVTDLLNELHSFNLCAGIQAPGPIKGKCLLVLCKKNVGGNFRKLCINCRREKIRLQYKKKPKCKSIPKCRKCTRLNHKVKTLKEKVAHFKKRCAFLRKSVLACDQI